MMKIKLEEEPFYVYFYFELPGSLNTPDGIFNDEIIIEGRITEPIYPVNKFEIWDSFQHKHSGTLVLQSNDQRFIVIDITWTTGLTKLVGYFLALLGYNAGMRDFAEQVVLPYGIGGILHKALDEFVKTLIEANLGMPHGFVKRMTDKEMRCIQQQYNPMFYELIQESLKHKNISKEIIEKITIIAQFITSRVSAQKT